MYLPVLPIKKWSHGGLYSWYFAVYNFISVFCCAGWYSSPLYRLMEEHYFQKGLCLVWWKAIISSLGPSLHCSVIFTGSSSSYLEGSAGGFSQGAIGLSTGCPVFYSNVFMVPKHSGSLHPILSLKQFNCYMHTPFFRIPTIKKVKQLLQQGDYAFFIDRKDVYLHILVEEHHCCFFLWFVWQNMLYQWRFCHVGLLQTLGFSLLLLNLYCSSAIARVFALLFI